MAEWEPDRHCLSSFHRVLHWRLPIAGASVVHAPCGQHPVDPPLGRRACTCYGMDGAVLAPRDLGGLDGAHASQQSAGSRQRHVLLPSAQTLSPSTPGTSRVNRAAQCFPFPGMPSPNNQTDLRCSSRNNQKVVLTGIQYHFARTWGTTEVSKHWVTPDRPTDAKRTLGTVST